VRQVWFSIGTTVTVAHARKISVKFGFNIVFSILKIEIWKAYKRWRLSDVIAYMILCVKWIKVLSVWLFAPVDPCYYGRSQESLESKEKLLKP
jgi:hypothetical protein